MEVVTGKICYEPREEIGVGEGMHSTVFLAWDPQRKGTIVVKEVPKARFGNDPQKYYAEAELMFAAAHSHVVPTHYACETDDKVCIAMPFFAKGSLKQRTGGAPMSVGATLRLTHEVLFGIGQIHAAGLLHLDIKPTNILFDDNDRPLVADFGHARRIDKTGVALPGRPYAHGLTPELLKGVATVETDLYQVGLLMYRCVNGDDDFNKQALTLEAKGYQTFDEAIRKGRFPAREADAFLPHVPGWMRTCIRKALRPDPIERFHSATEFAKALANIEIEHDWHMTRNATETSWRAQREGAPALVVRLVQKGPSFVVETYTERDGKLRAKSRAQWKKDLDRAEADRALSDLFGELG